jgi:iron-sulfur cluster assembly accessory protein
MDRPAGVGEGDHRNDNDRTKRPTGDRSQPPGGCSGFSYEMFFDTETSSDDHVTVAGSVIVQVDSASAPHLVGATLNYSDGLQGAGFSIDNPNAQRSCGCGQSFS